MKMKIRQTRAPNTEGASLRDEDSKPITSNKTADNPRITSESPAIREHLASDKEAISQQLASAPVSIKRSPVIRQQIASNYPAILTLTDLQRRLLDIAYEACSALNSDQTGPIRMSKLTELLNTTSKGVNDLILKVERKGVIQRLPGRRGPQSYVNLYVPPEIRQQLASR